VSPRLAYVLALDWAEWNARRCPQRWFNRVAIVGSGVVVLALGAVQLARRDLRRCS
jgi:hypothetical protein